jgi:hypothetical protein
MKCKNGIQQVQDMLILRFTQTAEGQDKYRVEIALEGSGQPRQTVTSSFDFKLAPQDQENLRWYLEDYLQYPHDPAPQIAERVEKRMDQIGAELFKALFQSSDDARDMWAIIRTRLNDTRIEIITGVREATSIPWELVRNPKTDTPLALRARSFVRAQPQTAQRPGVPQADSETVRILLVICRPKERLDVPFRSVASHLIKGLSEEARKVFQLEVLRPPTFESLGRKLRRAREEGNPYHIVHFDGHGTFFNMEEMFRMWEEKKSEEMMELLERFFEIDPERFSPELMYPRPLQPGGHGYLLFENPESEYNMRFVDGQELGKLLVEAGGPLLVLNACRSAHSDIQTEPLDNKDAGTDPHSQVRALGTFAQEVMDAGAPGVVAMRYNVYVATAARFVKDMYAALARGRSLGEAVTLGRKQLYDNPLREIAYEPRSLQDWSVPVVYEAMPVSLFPKPAAKEALKIDLSEGKTAPGRGILDQEVQRTPDAGFFGRDETLLALDRAFDTQHTVLLHAYAGNGKTETAREFARWYVLTGGVEAAFFTSFGQHKTLAQVLNDIERVFGGMLEQVGINWLALDESKRRQVALQVLEQIPVLWIWDNVEPVAGFPEGAGSIWSKEEQQELVDFLRDAKDTKAKFLLTSRREEQKWLGDLPARIMIPPMPMQERVQLARALAEKHGRRLTEVEDWRPLLEFTQGNPLTITVLVGQALREGLKTEYEIESFVSKLRAGEVVFQDEVSQGRARSLGASLSYGFEHAFTEEEQKKLALLYFFQGFVSINVFTLMGNPKFEWCLPEVRDITRESGIGLFDRAAEIGLLTSLKEEHYNIHPALPWFFKIMFNKFFNGKEVKAVYAFVGVMSFLGDYYHNQDGDDKHNAISRLAFEEENLLHALNLAQIHGWSSRIISTMQGLIILYTETGRWAEWARLVNKIVPYFVDPANDGPLPGLEEGWNIVMEYRLRLTKKARNWNEALRLNDLRTKWVLSEAASALIVLPEKLDSNECKKIRNLAISIHDLAQILRELGQKECEASYEYSLKLAEYIGDKTLVANYAMNIGSMYIEVPAVQNLEKAEYWCKMSLELRDRLELLGRAQSLEQLGYIAISHFDEARDANT